MYTYTPVEGDAGMYLRAMASYTDGYGDDSAANGDRQRRYAVGRQRIGRRG